MAHKILGIDLGAYSVKVVVLKAGFRKSEVVDWLERPLPPPATPEETLEERGARALGDLLRRAGLVHEVPYATLTGDALSLRLLDFPFANLKKADLDKAVGAELEGQLPHELDEMVYSYDTVPRPIEPEPVEETLDEAKDKKKGEADAEKPKLPVGTRLLAAATTKDRVQRIIDILGEVNAQPRGVVAAPAAYAKAAARISAAATTSGDSGLLVIDVGHARTNLSIIFEGKTVFGRTLSRGGRHVTQAIARLWSLSFEDAEQAKHSDGFVASSQNPAPSDAWSRISDLIKGELTPLLRDIRQTVGACRTATGVDVGRALLCGGGGRLNGLWAWLADELGIPVAPVTQQDAAALVGPLAQRVPADAALLALSVALEGAGGRPTFDLRTGPLTYKQDFSFLRARAGYLAACGLIVLAFAAGSGYASFYRLNHEKEALDARLAAETTDIFGSPMTVEELETKMAPKKEASPLPKMTAYDILNEMSKHLPPKADGKLDVMELEIEPKKVFIKGIADSSVTIDAVQKKLKEIECFGDVQAGRVDAVSDGKQFTMTINPKCM
jgi:Tfp pilus assembly PilM family ATPase